MRAGLAMYFVTLDDDALMAIADRIVAELEIEHFFNIQLVGEHVIEINPRISTIVYQEDLNIPYLGVKRALGEISAEELVALRTRDPPRPDRAPLLRPARVGRVIVGRGALEAPVGDLRASVLRPIPSPHPPGGTGTVRRRVSRVCAGIVPGVSRLLPDERRRPGRAGAARRAGSSTRAPAPGHALPGQHGRRPVDDRRSRCAGAASTRGSSCSSATRCIPKPTPRSTARRPPATPGQPVARRSPASCRRRTCSISSSGSHSCRARCSSRRSGSRARSR